MFQQISDRFAHPAWLSKGFSISRKDLFLKALMPLLVVYAINWGISTERALKCLVDGTPPRGRWVDILPGHIGVTVAVGVVAFGVLVYVSGRVVGPPLRNRSAWLGLIIVGFAWAVPLFATRMMSPLFPPSQCRTTFVPLPFFSVSLLNGPMEELWFAAAVAVWMLMWRQRPWVQLFGVFVGGGFLRGIFHIYQGWESVGLFVWGAFAGLAVAVTGRWVLLFILHYLHNALISAAGFTSDASGYVGLAIVAFIFLIFALVCVVRDFRSSPGPT